MRLTASSVAAASAAWLWVPDSATVVEDDDYAIMRLPDYFEYKLSVLTFQPSGPVGEAVEAVLARARTFGLPALRWPVRAGDQAGLAAELTARGATVVLTLDVLASDLSGGAPALPPAAVDVAVRWATDFATARDGSAVGISAFGGSLPPDARIQEYADRDAVTVPAGDGGLLVGYLGETPAGSGGVTMADGVARLWGGAVIPPARGQGIYRTVLATRLSYAAEHGATMALVKGKVDTSGPILRRAGFTAFGSETLYSVPL
ncbi:MAG TPA: GNAT family N-acetyltransferase [Trebonia sp.]